jgi:hypothetical protein
MFGRYGHGVLGVSATCVSLNVIWSGICVLRGKNEMDLTGSYDDGRFSLYICVGAVLASWGTFLTCLLDVTM